MNIDYNNFEIKFVQNWPEEDIIQLYKSGNWWKDSYDASSIKNLIKGSFKFAIMIDKIENKTIGMGRILSDGVSDAYIQDLVILNNYRNMGLGSKLVKFLVDYCISKGIYWIGLISEPGQDGFYSALGFREMDRYTPMKYYIDD
jgi:ribosomal protein S18 acetylase RimI-like enzyme